MPRQPISPVAVALNDSHYPSSFGFGDKYYHIPEYLEATVPFRARCLAGNNALRTYNLPRFADGNSFGMAPLPRSLIRLAQLCCGRATDQPTFLRFISFLALGVLYPPSSIRALIYLYQLIRDLLHN